MSWQIDYTHSQIQFSGRHLMVSTIRGQFDKFTGIIDLDEQNPAATNVFVEIDAASINSKLKDRDDHLRSPDFLDVENYPTITFQSTRVEVLDDTHAHLIGDLTIRGVRREVALEVEYFGQVKSPFGPILSAGFNGQTKISRKDWGLTWNALLETGGLAVSDEIKITIDLELIKPIEEPEQALTAETETV